ncbi:MAG TPA: G5 domain-containing protein [Candidatus Saccharimonadales bacterium]
MKNLYRSFRQLHIGKQALIITGVVAMLFIGAAGASGGQTPDNATNTQLTSTHSKAVEAPPITYKDITETEPIPFESTTVDDATLAKGTTKVTTEGVNGVKTNTYKVTYTDGNETKRELANSQVTTQPVTKVTAVGTYVKPAPSCDPNYAGACVPIASDVDCAGGSGNGPAYVAGPVRVVGRDIYGLDRDGNGVGCE